MTFLGLTFFILEQRVPFVWVPSTVIVGRNNVEVIKHDELRKEEEKLTDCCLPEVLILPLFCSLLPTA